MLSHINLYFKIKEKVSKNCALAQNQQAFFPAKIQSHINIESGTIVTLLIQSGHIFDMVAPIALVGLLLAKKAAAGAIYYAGKQYGWRRVYKRIVDHVIHTYAPKSEHARLRSLTRFAFRVPGQAYSVITESSVWRITQEYLNVLRTQKGFQGRMIASLVDDVLSKGAKWFSEMEAVVNRDVPTAARSAAERAARDTLHTGRGQKLQ